MYAKSFRRAAETRKFTVQGTAEGGWEVRDQADDTVLKQVRYDDWHRVERAMAGFAVEATILLDEGWVEA